MRRLVTRSFLAALLGLAGIELALHLGMADFFEGRFEYGYHPRGGIVEANGEVTLARTGARKFWPQKFPAAHPPQGLRIITVGDSIPRGASLEQSWPWLVGQQLRAQGVATEAISLSIAGYGAERKRLLVEQALNWSPDLLILQVGMSNEFEDERDLARAREFQDWHPRHWPMKSWLVRRFYEFKHEMLFTKWLPDEVRRQAAVNDGDVEALAGQDPARVRAWQRQFEAVTARTLAMAAARDVPVLLVPRVQIEPTHTPVDFDDQGLRTILEPALGNRVIWFDPARAFGVNPDPALFFRDHVHMHPPAHQVMAKAIAREVLALRAAGVVQPAVRTGLARAPEQAR